MGATRPCITVATINLCKTPAPSSSDCTPDLTPRLPHITPCRAACLGDRDPLQIVYLKRLAQGTHPRTFVGPTVEYHTLTYRQPIIAVLKDASLAENFCACRPCQSARHRR